MNELGFLLLPEPAGLDSHTYLRTLVPAQDRYILWILQNVITELAFATGCGHATQKVYG